MNKYFINHNSDEKIESLKKEIDTVKDKSLIGVIFEYLGDFILTIISFWR
jgi:hypothetical protein